MRFELGQRLIDIIRGKYILRPKVLYKNAKDVMKKNKIIKLNLGCGPCYEEGWINIDNNYFHNIKKLDLYYDLRKPLPFPENSVDFIFNEHFLEHLTVDEGQKFLKNCLKVLKPGGVIRIAMPDLKDGIECYLANDWQKYELDYVKTKAEWLNVSFRNWGHKWLYDYEELEIRLREAGFSNIKRCALRQSEHVELSNIEVRDTSLLIAEATK